jgi:hypothetical protein
MASTSKNFTSVSSGSQLLIDSGQQLDITLSGTFVATMQLVKSVDGGRSWEVLRQATAALSAPIVVDNRAASERALVMWRCVAYTSGTAVAAFQTAPLVLSVTAAHSADAWATWVEHGVPMTSTVDEQGRIDSYTKGSKRYLIDYDGNGAGLPTIQEG